MAPVSRTPASGANNDSTSTAHSSLAGVGGPGGAGGGSMPISTFPTDTVKDVAETLGIHSLKDSIASALAADVEYRIREIVQDASKYMRHSRRDRLKTTDVDAALRAKNIEPLYGFLPTSAGKSTPAHDSYPSPAGPSFRRLQTPSGPLHFVEDEEIDFEKVLEAGPRPEIGRGVGWAAHWLAIEGVQPAILQNPSPEAKANDGSNEEANATKQTSSVSKSHSAVAAGGITAELPSFNVKGSSSQTAVKPLVKHVLPRELQLYYERLTTAIVSPPASADEALTEGVDENADGEAEPDSDKVASHTVDADGDISMAGNSNFADTVDESKKKNENAASELTNNNSPRAADQLDLQSFEKRGSGNAVRNAALASLRGDPGLHQLAPYLVQWVGEQIVHNLRDPDMLAQMMNVAHALVSNSHLYIEPYLHQLMPSILSVLLTSSLGNLSSGSDTGDTSKISPWVLRSHAAAILRHVLDVYSTSYPSLKPRVIRTLLKALYAGFTPEDFSDSLSSHNPTNVNTGPRESPGTKLGALIGLRHMGQGTIRLLLNDSQRSKDNTSSRSSPEDTGTYFPKSSGVARLGDWLQRFEALHGEAETAPLVAEIKGALNSLDISPFSIDNRNEIERDTLESRYGAYWEKHLTTDARALAVLQVVPTKSEE